MAGSLTSIFRREESLHIPGIHAAYCARLARARRGKSDRSITRSADSFLGGLTPVGTCRGSHWEVRCCTTACQSSHYCFSLGKRQVDRVLISALLFLSHLCLGVHLP